MTERERLAAFQAALLEALADEPDPAAARARVLRGIEDPAHRAWIESFEDRGLETGMELVQLWGARRLETPKGKVRQRVLEGVGERLVERVVPTPEPGPGQARLRVVACGVCGTDAHMIEGRFRVPLPIVPGHEPVGVVEAVGEGVDGELVGKRVGVPWMQAGCGQCAECARGRPRYCGRQRNWITNGGGFADAMIVEAAGCIPLPDGLGFEHAAPLFCAGFTVMSGYRRSRARTDDRVAVLGMGGLGHLAIQIAAAHGHEVIAITRTRSKAREAVSMGAHEVLIVRGQPGRELLAAGGADVVLSTTSSVRDASDIATGLRPEGRLVTLGLGDGALELDPMVLMSRQAEVIGAMQSDRADLVDLLDLAAAGRVRPKLEVYRDNQIERALTRLRERRVRYRAVLRH